MQQIALEISYSLVNKTIKEVLIGIVKYIFELIGSFTIAKIIAERLVNTWIPVVGWALNAISLVYLVVELVYPYLQIYKKRNIYTDYLKEIDIQDLSELVYTQLNIEMKKDKEVKEEEIHNSWYDLSHYSRKTKRGYTNKDNLYYYEKDYTNKDMEIYRKIGSKGIHLGSCRLSGGKQTKPAIPGRTIDL
jgi:hypothetical protein